MALTRCYECGRQISTRAQNCPQCGAPNQPPSARKAGFGCGGCFLKVIGGFIGLLILLSLVPVPKVPQQQNGAPPGNVTPPAINNEQQPLGSQTTTSRTKIVDDSIERSNSTKERGSDSTTVPKWQESVRPTELCSAVSSIGFPSGTWKVSRVVELGCSCSNDGSMVQFGPQGPGGLPSNVSFFCWGSGEQQFDYFVLKLNINNLQTASTGKETLQKMANHLLKLFDESLSKEMTDAITDVKAELNSTAKPTATVILREESRRLISLRLERDTGRLTSISVRVRSNRPGAQWNW